MFRLFNYDSPVMQFLSKAFDIMLLGILWLVCSLPVFTVGASTTAMYTVLFKLVKDDGYSVIRAFFNSFKENFKQATVIWLIAMTACAVLAADLFFVWVMSGNWLWMIVLGFLLILAVLVLSMLLYVFPLQAYFANTVKNTIKNALLFSVAHFPKTLLMLIVDVAVLALILFGAQPLIMFAGVLTALPNAWLLNKIFAKYAETFKEEANQEST